MADTPLIEFRCPTTGCGKLLLKVSSVDGIEVEVRCPRCKSNVTATLQASDES
jgi:phage FluMu protein Com